MILRLLAEVVQAMAGYVLHYLSRGNTLSDAEYKAAQRFDVTNPVLIQQAGQVGQAAVRAGELAKVLSKDHPVADLFPGLVDLNDPLNVRVLIQYPEGTRQGGKESSVMVPAVGATTIQEVEDEAEDIARRTDSLPTSGGIDASIIPFLPFPPRSEQ
jgi:hypothetical protein